MQSQQYVQQPQNRSHNADGSDLQHAGQQWQHDVPFHNESVPYILPFEGGPFPAKCHGLYYMTSVVKGTECQDKGKAAK